MTAGLTPLGFEIKREQEILDDLTAALRDGFGAEILTGADSAMGRLAGIMSKPLAELWELAEAVYASQYPASADGVALDNVLDLNGLRRIDADQSRVWQILVGDPGTLIPSGSRVSHAQTGARFSTQQNETLDLVFQNLAVWFKVTGEPHGAGETYTITVHGIPFLFTTVGGETDADIASGIAALIDPSFPITAIDQGLRQFTIAGNHVARFGLIGARLRVTDAAATPSNNGQYTIVSAVFSGGDTIVTVAQEIPSFEVTGDLRWNVAAALFSAGSDDYVVLYAFELAPAQPFPDGTTDASDFTFSSSYTSSIPANLALAAVWRATESLSDDTGPIEAGVNTLTVIETPVTGWGSTGNVLRADEGRDLEEDPDARQRRNQTVRVGLGPAIDGLLNALLETDGVTVAQVFVNETDAVDVDGRPAHSIECVVDGGKDEEVAATILARKAAGIATFGNTIEVVLDSQGFSHSVRFSRAVDIPIWVDVDVIAVYDEEALPALPADAIAAAIVAFGDSFRGGLDVIPQRLSGAIFAAVPGLQEITVEVGTSPATTATPVPIAADEIARFDTSRVAVIGV